MHEGTFYLSHRSKRSPQILYVTFFLRFFTQPTIPATPMPMPAERSVVGSGVLAVPVGFEQLQSCSFGRGFGCGFTHGSTGGTLTGEIGGFFTGSTGVGGFVIVVGILIGAIMGGKNARAGADSTPSAVADTKPRSQDRFIFRMTHSSLLRAVPSAT